MPRVFHGCEEPSISPLSLLDLMPQQKEQRPSELVKGGIRDKLMDVHTVLPT